MADPIADDPRSGGGRFGLRSRVVIGATLVVGAALTLAAIAMVLLLERSLTNNVRSTATIHAQAVADLVSADAQVPLGTSSDDEFVQIVDDDGRVTGSTDNVSEGGAVARLDSGESTETSVGFDDDPFMVVAAETADGSHTVLVGRTLDNVVESIAVASTLLAIGMPLLLILIAAVTWIVVGRALAPVERIRAEVDEISTGRLNRRVPDPGSRDEIGRLAATMNRMLGRLEAGQSRQRHFVSDASHELRSPVSTIRQHAELALAHPSETSTQELARVVLDEDLRLQQLVEDLLLLARMDEGAASKTRDPVDLDDAVLSEAERLRRIGDVTVTATAVSAGRVLGDAKQLSSLVMNLLDNAVRHARTQVVLSLGATGSTVTLTVEDDGSGVPPDDRDRIFDRFERLDEARDRSAGGSGLGLAIVAEVAEAHGGTVSVGESTLGGARFVVTLPEHVDVVQVRSAEAQAAPGTMDR